MTVSNQELTQLTPTTETSEANLHPTWVPRQKVTAGGLAGALVTFTVIILNTYVFIGAREAHKVPAELSSAATVLLSFVVAYLIPPDPRERSIGTGTSARSTLAE